MMTMPEAMKEATHSLLQRGENMRTYDVKHPPSVRDMTNAFDTHARGFQLDSKGGTFKPTRHPLVSTNKNFPYKCKNKRIHGTHINPSLL